MENLNRCITSCEVESKKLPENQSPGPDDFTDEVYQSYKEELIPVLLKLLKRCGDTS